MKKKSETWKRINIAVNTILFIGTPILLLLIWEIASRKGILLKSVMPAPSTIVNKAVSLIEKGSLQTDILVSGIRIVKGFLLGTIFGVLLGIAVSLFKKIDCVTAVLVSVLRPIPIVALLPLFILWFGIDERSKVAVICLGAFWPVLLNTIQGIRRADPKIIEVAKVLKLPNWKIVLQIILPSAFPYIFTGVKLAVGGALGCVVTAEMVAASEGLGYMVMYARMMAQPDALMVGVIVLGVLGLLVEAGMNQMQKHLFKY